MPKVSTFNLDRTPINQFRGEEAMIQNRLVRAALRIALTIALAGCGLTDGAPSEADMKRAIDNKFSAINAELDTLADKCRRRDFEDNPMIGLQCLSICVSAADESCKMTFALTEFRKIDCKETPDQPGYVCDFVLGFSSSSPFLQKALSALIGGGGSAGQGRFVKSESGWMFLSFNQ